MEKKKKKKNDEKWCFLSVLSEEMAGKDPEKITELDELGLDKSQLLYTNPEAVAIERPPVTLQGPRDLRKRSRAFQPPSINLDLFWNSPYVACFQPLWSKDSLVYCSP